VPDRPSYWPRRTTAARRDAPSNPHYRRVAVRAGHRCEYCRLSEALSSRYFHVDHIVPQEWGGLTFDGNLALACDACNETKRAALGLLSPSAELPIWLFNPRVDSWDAEFRLDLRTGEIIGKTEKGRVTAGAGHEPRQARAGPAPLDRGRPAPVISGESAAHLPRPRYNALLLRQFRPSVYAERVETAEALDRVTAEPILSQANLPAFARAAMDGLLGPRCRPTPGPLEGRTGSRPARPTNHGGPGKRRASSACPGPNRQASKRKRRGSVSVQARPCAWHG
jgi:hypothetical protein